MILKAQELIPFPLELLEAKVEFRLTGSRFFGTHTVKSDYDFFASHCDEAIKTLKDAGFTRILSGYKDRNTVEVWYLIRAGCSCHVQLEIDVELKSKIQQLMKDELPYDLLENMSRRKMLGREIWDWAYQCAELPYKMGRTSRKKA
jgi:hypothetical protein